MGRLGNRWKAGRFGLGPALAVVLGLIVSSLILPTLAYGQGLGNDRLAMNQLVRQMIGKPRETYIADTTLNRFISYAHQTTKLALGASTDVDLDTIVTTENMTRYSLNTDARRGRVAAVFFRANEVSGSKEKALQYVPPEMVERWGDAAPGDGYSVLGQDLIISKSPFGKDTLFVYYMRLSTDLTADTSDVQIAEEDETAIALLTACWVAYGDGDLQRGQLFYMMWKEHLSLKGVKFPVEEPVVR